MTPFDIAREAIDDIATGLISAEARVDDLTALQEELQMLIEQLDRQIDDEWEAKLYTDD